MPIWRNRLVQVVILLVLLILVGILAVTAFPALSPEVGLRLYRIRTGIISSLPKPEPAVTTKCDDETTIDGTKLCVLSLLDGYSLNLNDTSQAIGLFKQMVPEFSNSERILPKLATSSAQVIRPIVTASEITIQLIDKPQPYMAAQIGTDQFEHTSTQVEYKDGRVTLMVYLAPELLVGENPDWYLNNYFYFGLRALSEGWEAPAQLISNTNAKYYETYKDKLEDMLFIVKPR